MNKLLVFVVLVAFSCSKQTYPDVGPEVIEGVLIVNLTPDTKPEQLVSSMKKPKLTVGKRLSPSMNIYSFVYKSRWHPRRVLEAVQASPFVEGASFNKRVDLR